MGNILMDLLKVENLICGYGDKEVLKGVSFSVGKGDFLGIVGPNGAGKTTLFRAITCILKPLRGEIFYCGKDLNEISRRDLAREIAVLPQILETSFSFSVEQFISMGRFPHLKKFQPQSRHDSEMVEKAMALCDVLSLRERKIWELSGGEKQRVILAQCFAQEPSLLLLDEPTAHLDIGHQVEILDLIKRLNREKDLTVIMVLHDLNLASEYCDRLVLLKEGRIFKEGSPQEVLTFENIEEVYNTVVVVKENPISSKPYILLVSEEELNSK